MLYHQQRTNAPDPRTVRWGIPADTNESGYDFSPEPLPPSVAVSDGTPFVLGQFNHHNFPVFAPLATSVDLDFTLFLDPVGGGAVPPSVAGKFTFNHEETPNQAPCAYGATNGPCNDRVTVSTPLINTPFTFGGGNFFFNLIGFSTDGGTTISNQFITGENQENPAVLYGRITETPIPEPTALLIFGTGLVGLGLRLRRRQ
jgi:hypothetical protein